MGLAGSNLSFARGLKSNFANAYKREIATRNKDLDLMMDLGLSSDGAAEDYFYYLSAPHPVRVPQGDDVPRKGFGGRRFRVVNHNWELAVDWHEDQEADDQTNGLVSQVRQAAQHFALLPERVFYQILNGATDADLLPAIPNAGDGAALYSTTDGDSANRFGASSGNLLSSVTLTTEADIQSGVYQGVEQFHLFQDTEGQPLSIGEAAMRQGIVLTYNVQNHELFVKAFLQHRNIAIIQNAAGTENVGGATPSNWYMDSGLGVTLVPTQRITDSDIFIFIRNFHTKAVFQQVRQALRDDLEERANSDRARRSGIKAISWKLRAGFSPCAEPYMTVKVTT